jgi:ABC-type polar amino acid transport system ATPase subunit
MYTLEKAARHYSGITAIRDATCTIPTNGLAVVMGPSGSGKSTLLRLLSFVEQPDEGSVSLSLDGHTYTSDGMARPWPQVTCVFQKLFLWPHLTLIENIRLPLRVSRAADVEERVSDVVELFDMSDFIGRYPNEVSGGQAQRAALARALVLRPKVILIDEAHTGLDLEQQRILNERLHALRSRGVGLVIVSHSLSFAYQYADTVIVLEEGAVVESLSRSVMTHPRSGYLRRAVDLMRSEPGSEADEGVA